MAQVFSPRGDGVDVMIGAGRDEILGDRGGYFLMVESDLHDDPALAFRRTVELDGVIERTAAPKETLVIFAADHSFDLRVRGGKKGESLLANPQAPDPSIRKDGDHTGERSWSQQGGPAPSGSGASSPTRTSSTS